MLSIFDFCQILEPEAKFTDEYVKNLAYDYGIVPKTNFSFGPDKKEWGEVKQKLQIQYCKDWQQKVQKLLRWRKPHIQDGWIDEVNENPFEKLWVLPRLLPVGKNEYIIRRKDEAGVYQYSVHSTLVDVRTEEIPFCKQIFLILSSQ